MKRKSFIRNLSILAVMNKVSSLAELNRWLDESGSPVNQPVLFIGHGSPMNAIEENVFVQGMRSVGQSLTRPRAILCVSAHWETRGTQVTAMERPKTIHDFGGFPKELYEVQYPAPGYPQLAEEIRSATTKYKIDLDHSWGLDHGSWSVIKHLYPKADVPVLQLSLDVRKSPREHYELAGELAQLRKKGVLIIGSGNMVHNLRRVAWDKLNGEPYAYDWATEANELMKSIIQSGNHDRFFDYQNLGQAMNQAVPTPEHFLPLLYVLALQREEDDLSFFNDLPVGGSITMTSVQVGC